MKAIINNVSFETDGFHSICKETRVWGNNGSRREVFFIPDEYITNQETFEHECNRIYRNFYA
jgi:hypothetical protein